MLNLNEGEIRTIVAEAIVAKLDEKSRVNLIQSAVTEMLTPKQQGYSSQRQESPLETAFKGAVHAMTIEVTRQYIADHPEVKAQIEMVMIEGLQELLQNRYEFRKAISSAVAAALEKEFSKDDD